MADIGQTPLSLPNKLYTANTSVLEAFSHSGYTPNILMDVASLHTVANLMYHNFASSFLLKETDLGQSYVRKIPIDPPIAVQVGIISPKDSKPSPATKQVISFLNQLYGI